MLFTDAAFACCDCSSAFAAPNAEVLNALCGLLPLSAMPVAALWTIGWLLLQVLPQKLEKMPRDCGVLTMTLSSTVSAPLHMFASLVSWLCPLLCSWWRQAAAAAVPTALAVARAQRQGAYAAAAAQRAGAYSSAPTSARCSVWRGARRGMPSWIRWAVSD